MLFFSVNESRAFQGYARMASQTGQASVGEGEALWTGEQGGTYFDRINKGLQELFPKVFGGGHAYLELTGDDLLDTRLRLGKAVLVRLDILVRAEAC